MYIRRVTRESLQRISDYKVHFQVARFQFVCLQIKALALALPHAYIN